MDSCKSVVGNLIISNYYEHHIVICDLSLQLGSTKSHKNTEEKLIFQTGTHNNLDIRIKERLIFFQ